MDEKRSKLLEGELRGKQIDGWLLEGVIDCGKSAAVFRATKGETIAAVKIFDRELIARFGEGVQAARIARELGLIKNSHPNVVDILGGGYANDLGLHFIVMEFLPFANLSKQVEKFDHKALPLLVAQLASAARHLESLGLVHRDIKPSNIIWLDSQQLKLLDLGVLGPVGDVGALTDMKAREFIGTLQYSSPEYLIRAEQDTLDGWRAVNFYQIGAVMHDLIMGRPLFQEFSSPYGRLVNAVQYEQPLIQNAGVPTHIVDLARRCLVKDPGLRLSLVSWSSFDGLEKEVRSSAKERVTNRLILSAATVGAVAIVDNERQRAQLAAELGRHLKISVRAIRNDSSVFPPITVVCSDGEMTVKFAASLRHQLPNGLSIMVRWNVIDPGERVVELTGKIIASDEEFVHETTFFKGIVDMAAIYSALEELVYTMLDSAQQAALG